MSDIMKLILSLSLSGSILAGFLFVMKPFIKHKLSKSIQYYIWIVVLLRLVVPLSFDGSIMNNVFYGDQSLAPTVSLTESSTNVGLKEEMSNSVVLDERSSIATGLYNNDADHGAYFQDLLNQYIIVIWLIGVIIALTVNLTGYTRFTHKIKKTSRPAADWENSLLASLLDGRHRVWLVRNSFATSPMLIGFLRPMIIIPNTAYSEIQLRNILLHEITHLKRYDIGVKWFLMIVTSLHWFNPLMYWIKKEMNHAGELSCDEAVIRNLSSSEKQQYGDTLISVASENKYPIGVLQATFSEEKTMLRERLMAIMQHNRKSKMVAVISIILSVLVIGGAVALGASEGISPNKGENYSIGPVEPPSIIITHERATDPIENYRILMTSWNGVQHDRPSFYYTAWHSEPTLLTGLRRLKPGEKLKVDFGKYTPDKVTVNMAYLTDSFDESLLPIIDVSVIKVDGMYEFINPLASESDIPTTGRVFSITATWGENSCEYVFASDGKFDNYEYDL